MSKTFTRAEVKTHSSESDLWIILKNKVYDVTKFAEDHPGGGDILIENGGKDATDDFEDIGHSSDAVKMAEDYLIGELVEADRK